MLNGILIHVILYVGYFNLITPRSHVFDGISGVLVQ